jgi:hypothetical protein
MARTFVRVELVHVNDSYKPLWAVMGGLGFTRTVTGRRTGKAFRLPLGLYSIDKSAEQALALTKQAVDTSKVEARVFCVPAERGVRFGNLQEDDEAAEDETFGTT